MRKGVKRNNYSKVYNLFNEFGYISGPNVHKNNMAYNDNETMLIYDGGGIGDKIMLFRFIYLLKQNVIFFVNDNLKWIFEQVCPSNVRLVGYKEHSTLPFFSSHCSLFYLVKALNLNQDNLTFHPYMESLQGTNYQLPSSSFSKKYIFNWKGNSKNCQEKFNRSVPLEELNNMFSNLKHSHQFIIVNKDITHEENLLLKKHSNVLILHDIDNQKTFEHTIDIIKKVDGVISSDTSIIHLSLTMGIASYLLLTKLCDWRWNNVAKWYPEAVCLQQQKQGEWKPVVEQLINTIR